MKEKKIVLSDPIQLDHKRNNAMWKIDDSDVEHSSIDDKVVLMIEKSKRESKYGIKLIF
jgi:hypothetical protein